MAENPLYNPTKMNIIRRKFREIMDNFQNQTKIKITIRPSFFETCQLTLYVHNIPNILNMNVYNDDNLLFSLLEALIAIVDSADFAIRTARNAGRAIYQVFRDALNERVCGRRIFNAIAHFLDTNEQLAIEFFISSIFSTFGLVTSGVIALLFNALKPYFPIVSTVVQGVAIIFFVQSKKAQIEMEKGKNKILILNQLFAGLNDENIGESNVVVVSCDEFDSFNKYFRSNHGARCDITYINNLPCAPRIREIPGAMEIIQAIKDVKGEITTNGNYDIDKIRRRVERLNIFAGFNRMLQNH